MTTEDLKIGNYVILWDKHIQEVKEIRRITLITYDVKSENEAKRGHVAWIGNYTGIPLTEQWLNKLGFREVEQGEFHYDPGEALQLIIIPQQETIYLTQPNIIHGDIDYIELEYKKYVHEVQNLINSLT